MKGRTAANTLSVTHVIIPVIAPLNVERAFNGDWICEVPYTINPTNGKKNPNTAIPVLGASFAAML